MTGVLKLYLLGVLISAPGIADQNAIKIAKAQVEPQAVVAQVPHPLNNYKTCLHSAKKQYSSCTTGLNKSMKAKSAHTIFKKQRMCEMKKEKILSGCKRVFLRR
ncbi:MAG: hypothetical protein HOK41_06135 [Nitrospina sp.]|jgi:hypothetical protein|nr:hypothetical protein [Nitrospina sp.]MBT6716096.1 hypothetical protein [Nitrospina sp.]